MKNLKIKSFTILALFVMSTLASSMISNANAKEQNIANIAQGADPDTLNAGLGQMFGMFRDFGASGELLGDVLELMFTNFENMTATQEIDGVYVLNASIKTDEESGTYVYSEGDIKEYHPWGVYNLEDATDPNDRDEFPYFHLNESGYVNYNKTEGISVTFIIWDNDGTFIDALDKLISTFKEFKEIEESGLNDQEKQEDALEAVVSALTYFFIHINDIISGDEVIILNTIAFTNYVADFNGTVTANWYVTEEGVKTNARLLETALPTYKSDYTQIAEYYGDEFMLFLLDEDNFENNKTTQNYTSFSFDIIEVWLKEFQVSIDSEAIVGALAGEEGADYFGNKTATDIFQELKLEFYVFTHHFQNWYLYDDDKFDKEYNNTDVQAQADAAVGNGVPDVLFEEIGEHEGVPVHAITDAEVIDYILFRGADKWTFKEPVYDAEDGSMEWGIRADNLGFRVIPMGLKDEEISLDDTPVEYMEYMELGFSFTPSKRYEVETGDYINAQGEKTIGHAQVKLEQEFGQWELDKENDNRPFTPHLKNTSLDLTTVFMSTIFHFKLWIENKEIVPAGETATDEILNESNYNNKSHHIRVGNIEQDLPLADIDIAGPEYNQSGVTNDNFKAKTTIIPTVYAEFEGQSSETYTQNDTSTGQINATLNIEFSTLIYAVSYDNFGTGTYTSGDEIIHDPTFSIFITTTNPGVIAIILVIGAVGMAGIAAVLITKKKNAQF